MTVNFEPGFVAPEMVKRRLAIVLSPAIQSRVGVCTVVPLSTTRPNPVMPFHYEFTIPFEMPKDWGNIARWVKGDMVTTVGWHRIDLLRLPKSRVGRRRYQTEAIEADDFLRVRRCVLHGMGFSALTKHTV